MVKNYDKTVKNKSFNQNKSVSFIEITDHLKKYVD
jgi:hypothetical protein